MLLIPGSKKAQGTPLPKLQLSIIMLIQICEPLASQSISPYINQLVSELEITGGDEKKQSLFFLAEALTVLQWSRASDRIGRKPILLIGLFGVGISILCFGLSRTFWTLVVSRCLCGLLNGNLGVMKSVMGDLTDRTNRAEGFAYLPSPLIGGSLARPNDHFPILFSGTFWKNGSLEESVASGFRRRWRHRASKRGKSTYKLDGPLPLRKLLIFPVVISVSNYVALAFLDITLLSLLPLFLAMPIEFGGLGLSPPKIGVIMSAYGLASGLLQVFLFARLVRHFGEKRVFINGMISCLPVFGLFPIMSMIAQRSGLTFVIWILVGCVLALGALLDTSYGAIFMLVTASAPKSSRGTVNGLSQTSVALARAIGPAMSTSLFSLSVQHHLLGGYMVYLVYFLLSILALYWRHACRTREKMELAHGMYRNGRWLLLEIQMLPTDTTGTTAQRWITWNPLYFFSGTSGM
ncbi:major facilitator superfamily domain-containing protein [Mycena rosella]|uniref:Major facilitator superfamily domain-containing protein n=1 Tax=Mycena rosella TaxID=1033263 RepID=A0AAD7CWB5_MYCRO|nr:major facilitator superfamily domain-containing protein [Mycena rosella]